MSMWQLVDGQWACYCYPIGTCLSAADLLFDATYIATADATRLKRYYQLMLTNPVVNALTAASTVVLILLLPSVLHFVMLGIYMPVLYRYSKILNGVETYTHWWLIALARVVLIGCGVLGMLQPACAWELVYLRTCLLLSLPLLLYGLVEGT